MATLVGSDLHFNHARIMDYCPGTRVAKDVEHMNRIMIHNWQSMVSPDDTVIIVGDLFMGKREKAIPILSQLPGHKVLVPGNHDDMILEDETLRSYFEIMPELWHTKIEGQRTVFCHYPIAEWRDMGRGSFHLHGHVHGNDPNVKVKGRMLDVGIDARPGGDMMLWRWEEIVRLLSKIEVRKHGNNGV